MKNSQFIKIGDVIINKDTISNIIKTEKVGGSVEYFIKVELTSGACLLINFKCQINTRNNEFEKACNRLGVQ